MAKAPDENPQNVDGVDEGELERLKSEYIKLARRAVDRAKALLKKDDGEAPVYAALELRQAFEALVYENALRFTDELVGEDHSVWQPLQLLERLLEIDPVADADLELHMQDPATGEWLRVGRQQRVSLKALKKRYFALGNRLHTPSLAQMMRGKPPSRRSLLKLCGECVDLIEKDLGASMRLGRMNIFGHLDIGCVECGATIRRRLNAVRTPQNKAPGARAVVQVKCPKCPASYELRSDGANGFRVKEQRWETECPVGDCDGVHVKWSRELKDGMKSACPKCGVKSVWTRSFAFLPEDVLKEARER